MTAFAPLPALVFLSLVWSASVEVTPVDANPCEVCNVHGQVTVARVTWDALPGGGESTRECCQSCTTAVIDDAHTKHDPRSRRQIRVEIDPSAR